MSFRAKRGICRTLLLSCCCAAPLALPTARPQRAKAVGAAEPHFNEHEAWAEAERQARRNLAFGAVAKLQSATESRTGGTSNGALIATTATELREVVVRERWRDSRQLFVLVHARTVMVPGS